MSLIFFQIICFLLLVYCILILMYRYWWSKLIPFYCKEELKETTSFSIIIPARNEELYIEKILKSILENNYPETLMEIIVIDDNSTDNTAFIVRQLQKNYPQIRLFELNELINGEVINSYKKKAIEMAISKARGSWIVCTDADCIAPKNWLKYFDNYIQQTGHVFIAAPVRFRDNGSFLGRFQCLDFLSLQGITAASVSAGFHSMCNGANIAYQKEVFESSGGFKGIDQLASGDDMFLMDKIRKLYPDKVGYLFSEQSIITTEVMSTWRSFIYQRIRWASKASSYQDPVIIAVLILVYLLNFGLLFYLIYGLFNLSALSNVLLLMVIKTIIELIFLYRVAKFYHQNAILKWFPIMQPLHLVYTVIAGWFGKFGKYKWKGRSVN